MCLIDSNLREFSGSAPFDQTKKNAPECGAFAFGVQTRLKVVGNAYAAPDFLIGFVARVCGITKGSAFIQGVRQI